jgi:hypothetical protein
MAVTYDTWRSPDVLFGMFWLWIYGISGIVHCHQKMVKPCACNIFDCRAAFSLNLAILLMAQRNAVTPHKSQKRTHAHAL